VQRTVEPVVRSLFAFVLVAATAAGCGGALTTITVGGAVSPAPTAGADPPAATAAPSVAPPSPSATPAPTAGPETRLSGGAAALPATATGVAFEGHLLIADIGNRRIVEIAPSGDMTWSFPRPGDAAAAALGPWDDAHYAPDGITIVANSAATSTVIAIDRTTGGILWQAGTIGKSGRGTNAFSSPDDAVTALDGSTYFADILNCRIVQLSSMGTFVRELGDGRCVHDPPRSYASPNGAYPTADGDIIVTEITGSWISRIGADGALRWAIRAPMTYPSDAMAYPDGTVLVSDYVSPGQILRLAPDGTVVWRFDAGRKLRNPSSAVPLAENRVAVSDDFGSRVLIVDPTTNEIVREYTTVGGTRLKITDCVSYRPD
jgi:outer membrane protein assembly factor BamB